MSNKPVAAYAFVDNGYLERVIFAYLKKILNIFFDAMGDKWQTFTQDESLNIEKVTAEFQRYQIVKNVDKLAETQA